MNAGFRHIHRTQKRKWILKALKNAEKTGSSIKISARATKPTLGRGRERDPAAMGTVCGKARNQRENLTGMGANL